MATARPRAAEAEGMIASCAEEVDQSKWKEQKLGRRMNVEYRVTKVRD